MIKVRSDEWIDSNLYNKFPSVRVARNSIEERSQMAVADAFIHAIPELGGQAGITITHNHWLAKQHHNIIGHVENQIIYSKPQNIPKDVSPTAWVATKDGLAITEAIDNPTSTVSQVSKKINDSASKILSLLPLEKEDEFSKFSVAIDPRIISGSKTNYFLETNADGVSVLSPISKEKMEASENIILTYMTIDPKENNITQVVCEAYCLDEGGGHVDCHD